MNNSRIFLIVCIVLTLTLSACRLSASTPPPVTPTTNLSEIAKQATMTAVAKTPQTEGSETPLATSPDQEGTETAGETEIAPSNTPVPTDQPTSEPQQASTYAAPSSYTLHKGEWVYCLARRYDIHPVDLLNYNGLTKGAVLFPGETIQIPSQARAFPGKRALQYHPTTYTVTISNNTTYSIACEFGDVDPRAIAEVNDIGVDQKLSVGQTIQVP